jgi:hypothetical protein
MEKDVLRELQTIPGVGKSIAGDLYELGIRRVSDLAKKNPEKLYAESNRKKGAVQDPCLLYTFRCAVYFARSANPAPELLKWWNWKDRKLK